MDIELFKAVLTIYGPLVMGWVVAWLLWRQNRELIGEIMTLSKDSVSVNQKLVSAVRELRNTIDNQ